MVQLAAEMILSSLVRMFVEHHGGQVVARGGGDDDLLGAGVDVGLGLGLAGVEAGALQHHVHIQGLPGQVLGLGLGVNGDLLAIHGDGAGNLHGLAVLFEDGLLGGHGVLVLADDAAVPLLSGVILQEVSQHGGAGEVVDGDDLIPFRAEHLTECETTDAAKTVDCNFDRH